ncbi:TetR/AcrR family transcriptional regulator [Kribbella sandramycini]|uniref:AcrR family transcriptional regulator n=1 Tax=Kribbella sandramycini TaxID=60450 RepID=A0A7Y4L6G2_9ACTN|nr:TetR/AcrR family transcriptional regulator [Kribbella sandramycini]MBB6570370.1 AcrR family transcriptional regulator [Kribbella sandramycini]NOL45232.1 TetR/AcrR family transcriptional regulator [Kribbella sandramycini]
MVDTAESGTRSRTRRAILEAAAAAFARQRNASLGEIAAEAQVARSTLHRYFPDRTALIHALAEDLLEQIERLIAEADLEQGPPREALQRMIAGWFDLGPRLFFLFNEPTFGTPEPSDWVKDFFARLDVVSKPIEALVARGHADGVFAQSLPPTWINRLLWWMVYIACEAVSDGELTRYAAPAVLLQTLETGILAPGHRDD